MIINDSYLVYLKTSIKRPLEVEPSLNKCLVWEEKYEYVPSLNKNSLPLD